MVIDSLLDFFFVVIDCGNLNNPDNGRVEMNLTVFTSRAVYSCNQGYMISPAGAATERVCRIDGTWGGKEPTCQCEYCTHIDTKWLKPMLIIIKK